MAQTLQRLRSTTGKKKGIDIRLSKAQQTHTNLYDEVCTNIKDVNRLEDILKMLECAQSYLKTNTSMGEDRQKTVQCSENPKDNACQDFEFQQLDKLKMVAELSSDDCGSWCESTIDLDMGNKPSLATQLNGEGNIGMSISDLNVRIKPNQQVPAGHNFTEGVSTAQGFEVMGDLEITPYMQAMCDHIPTPVSPNDQEPVSRTIYPEVPACGGQTQMDEEMVNFNLGTIPHDYLESSFNIEERSSECPDDLKDIEACKFGIENQTYLEQQPMECIDHIESLWNCLKLKNPNSRIQREDQMSQLVYASQQSIQLQAPSTWNDDDLFFSPQPSVPTHIADEIQNLQNHQEEQQLAFGHVYSTDPEALTPRNIPLLQNDLTGGQDGIQLYPGDVSEQQYQQTVSELAYGEAATPVIGQQSAQPVLTPMCGWSDTCVVSQQVTHPVPTVMQEQANPTGFGLQATQPFSALMYHETDTNVMGLQATQPASTLVQEQASLTGDFGLQGAQPFTALAHGQVEASFTRQQATVPVSTLMYGQADTGVIEHQSFPTLASGQVYTTNVFGHQVQQPAPTLTHGQVYTNNDFEDQSTQAFPSLSFQADWDDMSVDLEEFELLNQ